MQTLQKIPKKPETIADLQINWTFNQTHYRYFTDFYLNFEDKNPNFKNYKIVPGIYKFEYKAWSPYSIEDFWFNLKTFDVDKVTNLMYFLHNVIRLYLKDDNEILVLERFIKIDNNTFQIEEQLPF